MELSPPEQRPRRIIRIREENYARTLSDGRAHRIEIMTEIARRHLDADCADCLRHQRIHGECMLRINRSQSWRKEPACRELKHVIGAIAQHDLRHLDAITASQRLLEAETVSVWIARDIGKRLAHGLLRERAHAERILVRSKLDDAGGVE